MPRRQASPGEPLRWFYENFQPIMFGDACVDWPYGRTTGGYGYVRDGSRAPKYVHHLVLEIRGETPPRMPVAETRHLCGRGHEGCITSSHLRVGTHKENQADGRRVLRPPAPHGTATRYNRHGCRCEPCRAAEHARYLDKKARRDARGDER